MKPHFRLLSLIASCALALLARAADAPARLTQPFDADWRFQRGELAGAEKPEFATSDWRTVALPHDWSIEGPFDEKNPTRGSGAFLPSGIGWYRKTFTLPASASNKRVFVEFDGVMQNSDVWINGELLGHRPFGYVSFRYELTGKLKTGNQPNVLAVRTDTSAQPASRWYSGAGIYRHVRLIVTDPVHLDQWATFVSADDFRVFVSDENPKSKLRPGTRLATVRVRTQVVNQSDRARAVALHIALIGPDGKPVTSADVPAQTIAAGASQAFQQEFDVANPQLWDIAAARLYRAVVSVREGNKTLDDETVTFGIRDAEFTTDRGFVLNGRTVKLKGVCLHHDGGAFGAAVPLEVWAQRLAELRTLGVNAIRTAHNPPDPGFLDLCDRMGFVVMDELFDCWTVAKNPQDYHKFFNEWSKIDVRDTVRRDRNHPSIIFYSAGNEIHDTPKEELAKGILAGLVAVFHENDPTRPVTQALFRPNVSHDYTNGLADLLDVIGTNYRDAELLAAWKAKPGRKIVGTEQRHDRETWLHARDNVQHSGQFLWSGVDYLGEAFRWPQVSAGSGLLDRSGAVKPMALERRSWWAETPVVAIVRRVAPTRRSPTDPGFVPLTAAQVQFADWSPANREPHDENVEVYSNADDVELFLNGTSLGAKPINADASPRVWKVPFAPGTLKAVAHNKDTVVATDELRTAGPAAKIVLSASRPRVGSDFESVTRIGATVVDANGIPVPDAAQLLTFSVDGPGAVVAVDNANNTSHETFQASERHAFRGRAAAWVRGNGKRGKITVKASAPELAAGSITLDATK